MMTVWEVPEPRRVTMAFENQRMYRRGDLDHAQYDTVTVALNYRVPMLSIPEPDHWMDEAACGGINEIRDILTACQRCPVSRQCLEFGTSRKMTGPYGGTALINGQPSKKAVW